MASAGCKYLGVSTRSGHRNAMKVSKERIHHRNIRHSIQVECARGFVLSVAMHPHTVEDQMICCGPFRCDRQSRNYRSRSARDFQPDKPVVVRPWLKKQRPEPGFDVELDFGQNVLDRRTMKIGAPRKRSDSSPTWRQPATLSRQAGIRRAGADHNPVRIIARLFRTTKYACENGTRLQFKLISTICVIDRRLQIVSFANGDLLTWYRSIAECAAHVNSWQLCRTIKLRGFS